MQLKVTVNGVAYDVEVEVEEEPQPTLGAIFMTGGGFSPPAASAPKAGGAAADGNSVQAPLSGTVARVLVEQGQAIEAGEVVLVLEAMKMETEISAPHAGTVSEILVGPGDAVTGGQVLVQLSD